MARKINKSLLSEGEMRRFMKLANISPLQEMGSMGMVPGMRDEEEEEEDTPGARDYMQEQDEEMEVADAEMEMDAPAEPDMEMDMEMGAEEGGEGQMIELDDFLAALETALEDVTGEEVSTDMDMAGGEEAPEEGGEELDMEMSPEPDMGGEEPEMAMGAADMEELAERVASRVRSRIMQESRKQTRRKQAQKSLDERANALTDRIFARLMKESR